MPDEKPQAAPAERTPFTPPSIALPKGGGAIRGIGEKFSANPVTGTGSMTVPIATSPGRSGFGPQLSLSYDSASSNGVFGFGWSLSLPAITRKTEKGLPQYLDLEESDVFILSGVEDLVPVGDQPPAEGYAIRRYRPRIEGLFARIERWTHLDTGEVHWRSVTKDNVLTIYGKDANARIADAAEGRRIFSWLICETRDDKGNGIAYEYKEEDGTGADLSSAHEGNRGARDDARRKVNRHLKHIRYGNRLPLLDGDGKRPHFLTAEQTENADWMFEVVFDYGEHDPAAPTPADNAPWDSRVDPFSTYRAGFEVRTRRLCRRVLMFHHFADEPEVGTDCLVRSTDFTYSAAQDPLTAETPVYTFLNSVTQSGYRRQNGGGYLKRSLPPLEFEYTQPVVQSEVEEVDSDSLENLPVGLDGTAYQWTDLHGEGIPGILTEQADAWFYKRNISPISDRTVEFAPLERVTSQPNVALSGGHAQFMDLAGDGQPDVVVLESPTPGLYEHDTEEGWEPFRPFTSILTRTTRDPNLKFVDLDGDGHADVLVSEDDAFVWHRSLAEAGFGPAQRVSQSLNEDNGPKLVFADGTQSIYLADVSGDGLTDLVRIRNGEVCYWPNIGYGQFGPKVTMDGAPLFDQPDQFDQRRIRLADIDGSGTTDLIYLHRDGARLYFNQSGNGWSAAKHLPAFPSLADPIAVTPIDLQGNGTACLVWSSPLPADSRQQMRYVNLMGEHKPHLLIRTINNLGAETLIHYVPSTKFYLEDKRDGRPWSTRLPFPVHVVDRVETFDRISRSRFVTRYAYHEGYFDGVEREFRGFGMVEQRDTEQFAVLSTSDDFPTGDNVDASSHVPPVLTRTWFHTGAYLRGQEISRHLAHQYFGAPQDDAAFTTWMQDDLLPDTVLPDAILTTDEQREAVRALKGMMLRQEVYGLDATNKANVPYAVTEQNFAIRLLQPSNGNHHAVFLTHPQESISYHYERDLTDPRISHTLTIEVDDLGNVRKSATIAYGRQQPDPALPLPIDRDKQATSLITYAENDFTNEIDDTRDYRNPLPYDSRTYELTGHASSGPSGRFQASDVVRWEVGPPRHLVHRFAEINYEENPTNGLQGRLIERLHTRYRRNDLTDLLPAQVLHSLALPGETYRLAFTPGLLTQVYRRPRDGEPPEDLLPDPAAVLPVDRAAAQTSDRGGYVDLDQDGRWWIPSGRVFLSADRTHTAANELTFARQHFFLLHRYRDPFHLLGSPTETVVKYDIYDLLLLDTQDAVGNVVTVQTADDAGVVAVRNDYRVLQPFWVTDPNQNRTLIAFDALGLVVGTAVMGRPGEGLGGSFVGFAADLTAAQIDNFYEALDPHDLAPSLLQAATTRIVYVLDRYRDSGTPAFAATIARETYTADAKAQITIAYSDGFGREIQKKIQAEPGPVADGGPTVTPRWVGSSWTIFNNKGKPVRQYEPFFSQLPVRRHQFEFGKKVGVSQVLFYDPVERVVATLHPNHTYEKIVFDPWRQENWDVNDTVLLDPRADPDVTGFFLTPDGSTRLQQTDYLPSWYALRTDPANAPAANARWPDPQTRAGETDAAQKAEVHRATPTVAYFDVLGRSFLTVAHNRFERTKQDGTTEVIEEKYPTRVKLDIEGNQREVRDAVVQNNDEGGRAVMRYDYDMLGNRIHQASMEAGRRWMLNDVGGKPIRLWDSRGHTTRTGYDVSRRPLRVFVAGANPESPNQELLTERLVYGEQHPDAATRLRARLYLHLDQAGAAASDAYDFQGNLVESSRRLAREYRRSFGWSAVEAALPADPTMQFNAATLEAAIAPAIEGNPFTTSTAFDALNRPVAVTTPDQSVTRPAYNETNLLQAIDVNLRGAAATTSFVTNIDYNAKGQRESIEYGNGAKTKYEYEFDTFRLTRLKTIRPAGLNGLAVSLFADPAIAQDLHYSYDAIGNITRIRDEALPTIQYNNESIPPRSDYEYDATYRLISATGREHIAQTALDFGPPGYRDYPFVGLRANPNDPQAFRNYTETYGYDPVGNITRLEHQANGGPGPLAYAYQESSLLEPLKQSNRLTNTALGNRAPDPYTYDVHGNTTSMSHLQLMRWDYRDQLRATARQVVNNGTPETTWYVYDATGQRVRKVTDNPAAAGQTPIRKTERFYLGRFEIYRKYQADGANVDLERETLHLFDDKQRVALVEDRTVDALGTDTAPEHVVRFQLRNHLGSAVLELDGTAETISYEEFFPFGATSYQSVRGQAETPKRYRYTAKERDEETGLDYHGARYYTPWLGRWISADPSGLRDGVNAFAYATDNPANNVDLTGNWSVRWRDVAIGAGVAILVVGAVALTAGLAAGPIAAGLATAGVSAETITALGTTAVAAGTAYGVVGTARTTNELVTGVNSATGAPLTDQEASRRLGALPVEIVATALGVRGLAGGGGGGSTPELPELPSGLRLTTPEGFTLDAAPATPAVAPVTISPNSAVGVGAGAPALMMSMAGGGGDPTGGSSSGRGSPNRERRISRETSELELREALESETLTPRQREIVDLLEAEYGREAIDHFRETGELPPGVENSHPYSVSAEPELASRPGDLVPRQFHRSGVHGGNTTTPLHGEPLAPNYSEESGFLILDENGRAIGQMGVDQVDESALMCVQR